MWSEQGNLNNDRQCLGFIPDICTLIRKYNLQYVLDCYIKEGIFPSKLRWKIILTSNIFRPDERVRLSYFELWIALILMYCRILSYG